MLVFYDREMLLAWILMNLPCNKVRLSFTVGFLSVLGAEIFQSWIFNANVIGDVSGEKNL